MQNRRYCGTFERRQTAGHVLNACRKQLNRESICHLPRRCRTTFYTHRPAFHPLRDVHVIVFLSTRKSLPPAGKYYLLRLSSDFRIQPLSQNLTYSAQQHIHEIRFF